LERRDEVARRDTDQSGVKDAMRWYTPSFTLPAKVIWVRARLPLVVKIYGREAVSGVNAR
jgi:hypothetical protein